MKSGEGHSPFVRKEIWGFSWLILAALLNLVHTALFKSSHAAQRSSGFASLYSKLWDYAEHSISHHKFNLPSALASGPIQRVNILLSKLYGGKHASLSFGGSSGALLTLLISVLPKLHPNRDLILFDDICHQSAIGGIIFGRWKALRLKRDLHSIHKTVLPLTFEDVKSRVEFHGAHRFAAIILVLPSYDGFKSPSEACKIYAYARTKGISVIVDGAWDAVRFRQDSQDMPKLHEICDVWVTSPHKRGLTPSSLGCIVTQHENIARLWDEALDLGFRSSSVSFVEIMIAEHRLHQIVSGNWDSAFSRAEQGAKALRGRIKDIHPNLYIVRACDVQAELSDPAHILINTSQISNFDSRQWAACLSEDFNLDVEKATDTTLLLLCASPLHLKQLDEIIFILKTALSRIISKNARHLDAPQ